ncbi:hypothetical protein N0Y54_28575 [Nostoc punctiforme UO1]|uniref:hypothetical protein n=1 Tax=Nostoc punctiforme TaxID=272131 RepID=UPI0030A31D4F
MTTQTLQPAKVGKTKKPERQSLNSRKYSEVRTREHLLPEEVELMRSAIKNRKKSLSNTNLRPYPQQDSPHEVSHESRVLFPTDLFTPIFAIARVADWLGTSRE